MPNFRFFKLVLILIALSPFILFAQKSDSNDAKAMMGVWVAEKVLSSGKEVPKEKFPFELHFTKDQLIFKFVGDTRGRDRVHEIVIDPSADPATIDMVRIMGDKKLTVRGIYKFDDEKLVICFLRGDDRNPSSERPSTFESSPDVPSDLLILKRKPAGDR